MQVTGLGLAERLPLLLQPGIHIAMPPPRHRPQRATSGLPYFVFAFSSSLLERTAHRFGPLFQTIHASSIKTIDFLWLVGNL